MDKIGLSLKLRRLASWLDARCRPDSLIRRQFHGAPFGGCYVTIDPGVRLPMHPPTSIASICAAPKRGWILERQASRRSVFGQGVTRFFVWLSPGPDMDWREAGWSKADCPAFGAPAIRPCIETALRRRSSRPISTSGRWAPTTLRPPRTLDETLWPDMRGPQVNRAFSTTWRSTAHVRSPLPPSACSKTSDI